MNWSTPTPVPYQGSKRRLAPQILASMPAAIPGTFYEPFAGSAAVALAAAAAGKARRFVLSDILTPLAEIWRLVLEEPDKLADEYEMLWLSQLHDPRSTYDLIRADFNKTGEPSKLLYLIARCVKNSIRFNPQGKFNQSPDNRRKGMRPAKMRKEILAAHQLIARKTTIIAGDYQQVLKDAGPSDFVYMDPPYQGVSNGKDSRYYQRLDMERFIGELDRLNGRNVPYMVSFDGQCGDRTYGDELPSRLRLRRILLVAGRSSQATLLGRSDVTVESLYLSPALMRSQQPSHLSGPNRRPVQQLSLGL